MPDNKQKILRFDISFDKKMIVKIYAIEIIFKSQEPFQSYTIISISKLVSVEMACLLGIQNEIQAVCNGTSDFASIFSASCVGS